MSERTGAVDGDLDAGAIARGLLERTLPRAEWTHEAHLAACWELLRQVGPDEAIDQLRDAIRRYN